jgi:hypothetical protein
MTFKDEKHVLKKKILTKAKWDLLEMSDLESPERRNLATAFPPPATLLRKLPRKTIVSVFTQFKRLFTLLSL